jgi:hypothetical protein
MPKTLENTQFSRVFGVILRGFLYLTNENRTPQYMGVFFTFAASANEFAGMGANKFANTFMTN